MSHRHGHRPPIEPHVPHPHLNGSVPNTPANGSAHPRQTAQIVSPVVPPAPHTNGSVHSAIQKLTKANEETWLLIGSVAEQMGDLERALSAYENALRHNPHSVSGLAQVAGIARIRENYPKAVEYFQRVLAITQDNGEVWSALGHCYLMQDDLQKAYSAYQQALYLLPNPKEDPKLWYGIGILYDRYGSLDHAEEAFASVLQMDKDFDKANEILFRLGIIYKQQGKYQESLECFDRILRNPPNPLAHADIWFQIGHVYEQQKDHARAKDAYERVIVDNPHHAKVLQQLGWLYHQDGSTFQNQELAISFLTKSLETDPSDAQSWYLLGRAYMAGQKYNKAYEAYQQAVYRDGRNPTFWCSIGVLYFQINQYRDALDAYSRAIRINPYISEVWFDLGSLYESCNNQISDAIDAYARASELDPSNHVITQRLQLLRNAQATGSQLPAAPGPQDVHPTAYANAVGPPAPMGNGGPPLLLHSGPSARPIFTRSESRGPPPDGLQLPHAPAPFRGGPPPPVVLDENRRAPNHTPLAPMDVDRPIHSRESSGPIRDNNGSRTGGPTGQSLLLHHPQPQPQMIEHHRDYGRPHRAPSPSVSPPPHRPHHSPTDPHSYQSYPPPNARSSVIQPGGPPQRSPRPYAVPYEAGGAGSPPPERVDAWDRPSERSSRSRRDSRSGPPPLQHSYSSREPTSPVYDTRRASPPPLGRPHSPMSRVDSSQHPISGPGGPSRALWDSKRYEHHSGPSPTNPTASSPHLPLDPAPKRYDPRFDERPIERDMQRDREMERYDNRSHAGSPEGFRRQGIPAGYDSPYQAPLPSMPAPDPKDRRRRSGKDKDSDSTRAATPVLGSDAAKKDKKRRPPQKRGGKDEPGSATEPGVSRASSNQPPSFKVSNKSPPTPEPPSASGSGSGRSGRPSPSVSTSLPPNRELDEDYDEGVAESLIRLSNSRPTDNSAPKSPTLRRAVSPTAPLMSHRRSSSSTSSGHSPPLTATSSVLKRPLSPALNEASENKRSKVEIYNRRVSPPPGRHTPVPPSRPSPLPFHTQPTHSPDTRMHERSPPSTGIPSSLPLPPPPSAVVAPVPNASVILPPIATLSPTASSTPGGDDPDSHKSHSMSPQPPSRAKYTDGKLPSPTLTRRPTASPPELPARLPAKDSPASPRARP